MILVRISHKVSQRGVADGCEYKARDMWGGSPDPSRTALESRPHRERNTSDMPGCVAATHILLEMRAKVCRGSGQARNKRLCGSRLHKTNMAFDK